MHLTQGVFLRLSTSLHQSALKRLVSVERSNDSHPLMRDTSMLFRISQSVPHSTMRASKFFSSSSTRLFMLIANNMIVHFPTPRTLLHLSIPSSASATSCVFLLRLYSPGGHTTTISCLSLITTLKHIHILYQRAAPTIDYSSHFKICPLWAASRQKLWLAQATSSSIYFVPSIS